MSEGVTVDDVQAEISDIEQDVRTLMSDLDCASACETKKDLLANLESALRGVGVIRDSLKELIAEAKKVKP